MIQTFFCLEYFWAPCMNIILINDADFRTISHRHTCIYFIYIHIWYKYEIYVFRIRFKDTLGGVFKQDLWGRITGIFGEWVCEFERNIIFTIILIIW